MKQSNEERKNKGGLTASSAGICAPSRKATVFMKMPVLATGGIASFPAVPLSVQMFLHLSFSHNNLLLSDDISYDKFRCRGKISLKIVPGLIPGQVLQHRNDRLRMSRHRMGDRVQVQLETVALKTPLQIIVTDQLKIFSEEKTSIMPYVMKSLGEMIT